MKTHIDKKLPRLPDAPGVYLFYNKKGELLYAGKATSLKDRVKSYWQGETGRRPIESMIHEVKDVKWKQTDSVLEAILLEGEYIKTFRPKYNIEWRDDKSWNYLVVTHDAYPRVVAVRAHEYKARQVKNYEFVFGPYPGLNTNATLKLLRKLFLFSTCQGNKKKFKKFSKPCFYCQIGLCLGVCTGEITPKEYRARVIRPLVAFLKGRKKQVLADFTRQMKRAVKEERFEDAGRLRDQIGALQRIQDVALLNRSLVSESLGGLYQFPLKTPTGRPRRPPPPTRGRMTGNTSFVVGRIEGYDISNLGPTGKVGSMVVFTDGEPDKSQYRRFRIRTVEGQSDVDCLEEVLRRRIRHVPYVRNTKGTKLRNAEVKLKIGNWKLNIDDPWPLPQLILVDGGLPQVNRAVQALKDAGIGIPVVGIAKGPQRKKNEIILGTKERAGVPWIYANTRILIRVRDEAHRFAISYQRKTRWRL